MLSQHYYENRSAPGERPVHNQSQGGVKCIAILRPEETFDSTIQIGSGQRTREWPRHQTELCITGLQPGRDVREEIL